MPNPAGTKGRSAKMLESKIRKLKRDLKSQKEEAEDWHSKLVYLQAEFENYRKRVEKEKEEFMRLINRQTFEKILPILDALDSAIESFADREDDAARGVAMIRDNLTELLKNEGLEEMECLGEIVDPYKHEVVHTVVDDTTEDNTIAEIVQKGYMYNHRVIRPSKVVAVKNSEE